jgi:predicted transcriptional regulator
MTKSLLYKRMKSTIHHMFSVVGFLEKNKFITIVEQNKLKIIKITEKGNLVAEGLLKIKPLIIQKTE